MRSLDAKFQLTDLKTESKGKGSTFFHVQKMHIYLAALELPRVAVA